MSGNHRAEYIIGRLELDLWYKLEHRPDGIFIVMEFVTLGPFDSEEEIPQIMLTGYYRKYD